MTVLAVAVLGPDGVGVIARLTSVLLADEGNLEDASMSLLRGSFAMTMVVSVPRPAEAVQQDLRPVAAELGLLISVREVSAAAEAPASAGSWLVRVYGADRPGLVHRVTALLAAHGGNITDLTTRLSGALYVLVAEVDLPVADAGPLQQACRELAAELGVEITVEPTDEDVL